MYTKFLIILLLIFIVFNSQKLKEKFSNAFQDTEIRAKLSHFGTNLDEEKPLLTLYYDRREPNCKYFYDYFSIHYGGEKNIEDYNSTSPLEDKIKENENEIEEIKEQIKEIKEQIKVIKVNIQTLRLSLPESMVWALQNTSYEQEISEKETQIEQKTQEIEIKEFERAQLGYQKSKKFTGKSQAWNQFKAIYANETDENKYIKPNFLKIEEIEVKDGELYDFNNKPAYKIVGRDNPEDNTGYVQYVGDKPREYKQYYKPDNFLDRIPKLVLSFFKHKSKEEIKTIMKDLDKTYANLKHFQKYDYYVIEYDGLYSPNNRQIKTTLDNIIKFINETYDKYLLCPYQESHDSRIGEDKGHTFKPNGKCDKCSEFVKI